MSSDYYNYGENQNSILIRSNGITIGESAILNFDGAGTQILVDDNIIGQVNAYIPPLLYVSHYNTSDGTTPATVASHTTASRYVSNPLGTFDIGDWVVGSLHDCTNSSTIVYTNENPFSIFDLETIFTVNVYGDDGVTVLATNEIMLDANKVVLAENITITVSGVAFDYDFKYKCNVEVSIDIDSILPAGGRFSVSISHNDKDDGIFTKVQNNMFYDINSISPTIASLSIFETVPVIKTLDGVNYYDIGSTFTVDITDIDNLNNQSYPETQVTVNGSEYGLQTLSLTGADLTNWNNEWNNVNASYNKTDWEITEVNQFIMSASKVTTNWIDWITGTDVDSSSTNILVNTYEDTTTNLIEDFINSDNRYETNGDAWDNSIALGSHTTTGLQMLNSQLVYPSIDFSVYYPDIVNQPDYSTITGSAICIIKLTSSVYNSNGILTFTDHNFTESMLGTDLEIEISTDLTNWYTLSGDYMGGVLSDGDSARVDRDDYDLDTNNQIKFTLGLGLTNKFIYVKITFNDTVNGRTLYLGKFEINWI